MSAEGPGPRRPLVRPLPPDGAAGAGTTAGAAAGTAVADPLEPPRRGPQRPVLDSVPRSVQLAAAWSWRLLVILIVAGLLFLAMSYGKVLWVSVVIALLLTVLLQPVVRVLRSRLRFSRGAAASTAVLGLLVVVVGLLVLAGRQLVQGFAQLAEQAEQGFQSLVDALSDGALGLDGEMVDAYIGQVRDQVSANSQAIMSGALSFTTTIVHVLAGAVITLFCLLFFLKDGQVIWAWLVRLLPHGARMPLYEASRRGMVTLSAYVRAQILVALADAIGIGLGAFLLGLPLVIPLTVLIFLASFIPFVGAVATGVIAVLVALVDQGPVTALWMLVVVILVQQLESNVLQPFLLGHAVSLHPVAVVLAVTAGSLAAGVVGALLAVPVVATLNTVILYLQGQDKFPHLGRDPEGLTIPLRKLRRRTARITPETA